MRYDRLAAALILAVPLSAAASPAPFAELAGHYYQGDGLGSNLYLDITPDGTFSYHWDGCVGTYVEASGRAALEDGELVLVSAPSVPVVEEDEPSFPLAKEGELAAGLGRRLLPVRWGDRLYLVPAHGVMELVNEINVGSEPREDALGSVYLRENDWEKAVSGPPDLPDHFRAYVLKAPVRAVVLRRWKDGTFQIGAGRQRGLLPGMVLYAFSRRFDPEFFLCALSLVTVDEGTAVAKETDSNCSRLRVGRTVATTFSD